VAEATAASLDRIGRLIVEPDLSLPGHPEILVLGDLAHFAHQTGAPLPGVAPVAMQQGAYAARLIEARLQGKTLPPFRYRFRRNMATIGRGAAVADLGFLRFSGFFAWLVWLFVHLLYLVEFSNRVLVLLQWAWNYFTRNRSARLITGRCPTG
jgi:NADH dehydrogenase